ncbi:MAG: F0F1 ATP synthase subunit B [bacterium]
MNITATLIGQMLTFAVLIWFIKAVLWEPMLTMLEDRKNRIAEGLAAAERGKHEQELAEQSAAEQLREAKVKASDIIAQAQKRAGEIVEESKDSAREEGERLIAAAKAEIEQESHRAKESLRKEVSALAVSGAEKILGKEIDPSVHAKTLDELAAQL